MPGDARRVTTTLPLTTVPRAGLTIWTRGPAGLHPLPSSAAAITARTRYLERTFGAESMRDPPGDQRDCRLRVRAVSPSNLSTHSRVVRDRGAGRAARNGDWGDYAIGSLLFALSFGGVDAVQGSGARLLAERRSRK